MTQSLLIFTISPVQKFIGEARRTHDLWAASRMLVEMMRRAVETVADNGGTMIYPAGSSQEGIPNRLVALLDADKATEIARSAEAQVLALWKTDFADKARQRLEGKMPSLTSDDMWSRIWDRQIPRYFHVYWVVCPAPQPGQYAKGMEFAAAALAARKMTREFSESDEPGLKDCLSGERSALRTTAADAKAFWSGLANEFTPAKNENPTLIPLNGKERLDAIGATKRFANPPMLQKQFPSVSSVAAAEFRRRAKQKEEATTPLNRYKQALVDLKKLYGHDIFKPGDALKAADLMDWEYDGDMLYGDTLSPRRLEDDYHLVDVSSEQLQSARAALRKLHDAAGGPPSTYYAILRMDADKMGERIGACENEDQHALSQALAKFADKARVIVEKQFAGRVVYAGGDDLLAFLPMIDALPAARAVRQQFQDIIKQPTKEERDKNQKASISAGIVLAHHTSPLDAALQASHAAEDMAKDIYGRNALCVSALKRSGERITVGAKWDDGQLSTPTPLDAKYKPVTTVAHAPDWLCFLFQGSPTPPLSPKFAYAVHAEARALQEQELREAFVARVRRLVSRHHQTSDFTEQMLVDGIADLARAQGTSRAALWLLLARFIATGKEE